MQCSLRPAVSAVTNGRFRCDEWTQNVPGFSNLEAIHFGKPESPHKAGFYWLGVEDLGIKLAAPHLATLYETECTASLRRKNFCVLFEANKPSRKIKGLRPGLVD